MNLFWKKIVIVSGTILVIGVSFFAGLYMNPERVIAEGKFEHILNKNPEISEKLDFGIFWKVWSIVSDRYVFSGTASSTPDQDIIYGAVKGLVGSLDDPYSEFMPPARQASFSEELSGSLEGVGMVVGTRNELLTVISPLKDSPADKAGVRAEDVILEIDGVNATSLSIDEAVKKIRGKKGTTVVITVGRKGVAEPIKIPMVRDVIIVPTLETKVLPGKVFLIRLYEFNGVSSGLFKKAMEEYYAGGYKKLILDLRNNPGGYLEAAVDMASYFIPEGKLIVKEDYGNKKEPIFHRSHGFNTFGSNMKMVVLINAGSASASEILAGALSDYGIATLVGEKSFGKGSVQELIPVTKDTALKLTVATWWTPNNYSINKQGLLPKIEVKPTEEQIKKGDDVQLEKAQEILKKR